MKIVDPDDFLNPRSSELAEHLVKFRRKEKLPVLNGSGPSAYVAQWKSALRREVAYQKTKEEERSANRRRNGKVKRGSKVQDVEEAPEAKRLRQTGRGSAKKSKKKNSSQEEEEEEQAVSFNVLEEAQKLAAEEEEASPSEPHDWSSPTPGRRRRTSTNRYAPK